MPFAYQRLLLNSQQRIDEGGAKVKAWQAKMLHLRLGQR